MLSQEQANQLIEMLKESASGKVFEWQQNRYQEELFVAVESEKFKFVLSLKRNPYEIRLHLRTRDKNIGLARIDNNKYHPNPDGTELRNTPHIHWFKERYDQLAWAEPSSIKWIL